MLNCQNLLKVYGFCVIIFLSITSNALIGDDTELAKCVETHENLIILKPAL